MSNKLDLDYQALLKDILENGTKKSDRTGTGTLSVFGRQVRHKMSIGFPLITTKKMAFKTIVTELLWFLKGDTNIKYLIDNNCHIWDGDCYKNYKNNWSYEKYPNDGSVVSVEPLKVEHHTKEQFIYRIKTDDYFCKQWGSLGEIYGKQWKRWQFAEFEKTEKGVQAKVGHIDQIANLIKDLKNNPDSRRLMVNAWNVGELDKCVLPPCHYSFQCYTRELSLEERYNLSEQQYKNAVDLFRDDAIKIKMDLLDEYNIPQRAISLKWNQRSCDFPLGIPANILSYSILLIMLAKQTNMVPDELIGDFGDCHIYLNQVDGVKEQLTRGSFDLPIVKISDRIVNDISEYTLEDITLENYKSHPKIHFPLSN